MFPSDASHACGTFIGMRISDKTSQAIQDYCKENSIPEPIDPEDMHVTICYSLVPKPDYPVDSNRKFINKDVKGRSFDVFGDDKNCLVLKIRSNTLNQMHQRALDSGLTHTYPDFTPHITFSYGLPQGFDASKLPPFDQDIHFRDEYKNGLVDRDDD
jgi:2'-5' RNA ligase